MEFSNRFTHILHGEFLSPSRLAYLLAISLTGLIGIPLIFYIFGSFWSTAPGLPGGQFSLSGYRNLLTPDVVKSIVVTFQIAILGTAIALVLGIVAGLLSVKYSFPGKEAIPLIIIIQYLLPGFSVAIAYELTINAANDLLVSLPIFQTPPLNVHGVIGISVVSGLHYVGFVYLLTNGSLQSISPSLEEAARLSGATSVKVFRNITIPLSYPAILISGVLVFTRLLQSFGIPLILGIQEGIFVMSTHMFIALDTYPPNFSNAAAIGMVILVFSIAGLFLQNRLSGPREQYQTIGGRSESAEVLSYSLGKYRYPVGISVVALLLGLYVLPFVVVFISSFQQAFLGLDFTYVTWTLDNYHTLFFGTLASDFYQSIINTFLVSGIGALVGMVLASLASYVIVKTDSRIGEYLDLLTLSPAALPGIVVATAFLWLFLTHNAFKLYGTLTLIVIALTSRFIVYGTRATNSAFRAVHDDMEEIASICGANLFQKFRDIFMPLIRPGFVSGYLLLFIDYMKVLTIPLLLSTPESEVIAVKIWQVYGDGQATVAAAIVILMASAIVVIYASSHLILGMKLTRI